MNAGEAVLQRRGRLRILPFLGPAFVAAVAYIDPGNFATNIAGGSKFGYTLLWVVVASNLMAMLVQTLSAKLGIATGRNLAEVCRDELPRPATIFLWVQAEAIAIATDLAEFLGAALGFHLLFGIGLFVSALLTGVCAFAILGVQRWGIRPLEAVIAVIVLSIGLCYVVEIFKSQPSWGAVGHHAVIPGFQGRESVLLAVGILGATVMPHVIWLHSALTADRIVPQNDEQRRRLMRFTKVDVVVAMAIAGLINGAMLVMAASTFFRTGHRNIGSLEGAHATLTPLLGSAASALFGIALLFSGLSSSAVGTLAGQVVMQGFIRRRIPVLTRRLLTMLPAFVVIALGADPSRTLVISQVVLSFGIPFALVPLVWFTSKPRLMGVLVNGRVTRVLAVAVAAIIVALNVFLLTQL
ncbi:MAG: Nramp family divalent metal transporter [Actinomycetota bacterium]